MDKELFEKLQAGRIKYQKQRSLDRLELIDNLCGEGISEIGNLTQRELFLCGIVLYWAEGFKHKDESGLGLATLDANMAKFYVNWLEKCLGVKKKDLLLRVTANIYHKDRIKVMEGYWIKEFGVDKDQFGKPFYQNVKWKREYPDRNTYFGVIRIRVRRSLNLLRKMRGWLAGISSI